MKLINLTPHDINLYSEKEWIETIPSEGVARISEEPGIPSFIEGIPVPVLGAPHHGGVIGLPPKKEGVLLIVSLFVATHVRRDDLVVPGTGPEDNPVRKDGKVVGVRCLKHVA